MRADPKNTTVSWIRCCAEAAQRLEVLGQDAQRAGVVAVDEVAVVVREPARGGGHVRGALRSTCQPVSRIG